MIITYQNYKGGINNLVVICERLSPYYNGVVATSTKDEQTAIKNFKRNYKKAYSKNYQ